MGEQGEPDDHWLIGMCA